ncbi:MAG: hypothetical protein SFY80_10445 [Verrucomicrobiota bacterium]|nr:hypothetical protein [Verrucomicrobiota bacterium]
MIVPFVAFATEPAWWAQRGVKSGGQVNNKGPINQGQLKAMAKAAMQEMDAKLPFGSSLQIQEMVAGFVAANTPNLNPANKLPANIGQLKAVAKPFYDWLLAMGYNTKQNLINHGAIGWNNDYPWSTVAPLDGSNYAPVSIGQLKWVFSFDFTDFTPNSTDLDSDGLPDWWERVILYHALYHSNATIDNISDIMPSADYDGDDISNGDEYAFGSNPTSPKLTLFLKLETSY